MGTDIGGTSLQNQYKDWLLSYNSNNGLDSTPRAVQDGIGNETPLQLSTAKVRIKPTSTDGDVFDIVDLSGTVLFTINTSTKTITAASGVKFSGDGSLLTGIISTGTGGASEADNLELQADNSKDGTGDILLKLGATIIATIRNNGTVDGTTGEPVGGSFTLLSLDEDKLATLTGDEIAYTNVDGVASVQDADGVHGIVLADKWSEPKGGYIFDGGDDESEITHADTGGNLDFDGDFSVGFWCKIPVNPSVSNMVIFSKVSTTTGFYVETLSSNGWKIRPQIWWNGTSNRLYGYGSTAINDNKWHHIVIRYDYSLRTFDIKIDNRPESITVEGDLGTQGSVANSEPLHIGSYQGASSFSDGTLGQINFHNEYITDDDITSLYNNGSPETAVIPFELRGASQTALTSGTLEVGKKYIIDTYVSGDDFTNVGAASNASGVEFVATGTTPTDWTNSSSLRHIGCVLEGKPENAGSNGWIMTLGGASVIANTSGSPIARGKGELELYRDGINSITGDTTLTDVIPAGYRIKSIFWKETAGGTATVNIGTDPTTAPDNVVNGLSVTGSGEGLASLASDSFSSSADQTLYISSADWSGAPSIDFIIVTEKAV